MVFTHEYQCFLLNFGPSEIVSLPPEFLAFGGVGGGTAIYRPPTLRLVRVASNNCELVLHVVVGTLDKAAYPRGVSTHFFLSL